MKSTKHVLATIAMLLCSLSASAHDFAVDGFYYNITSEEDLTVEMTFRVSKYDSYSDEYTGSITIPATVTYDDVEYSVTSIGNRALYGCSLLTSITILGGVTSIETSAFSYCSNLTSIVLPRSIRYIDYVAFAYCPELCNVYCHAESVPSTDEDAFYGSYRKYATLYVPASAIENYKTTEPWSNFWNIAALETSGIEETEVDAAETRTTIYDINGRPVTNPAKGVYIINGKKVVIK